MGLLWQQDFSKMETSVDHFWTRVQGWGGSAAAAAPLGPRGRHQAAAPLGAAAVGLRGRRRQAVFYIQNWSRVRRQFFYIQSGEQAVDLDYGSEAVLNENSHFRNGWP